jgi:hypothetical protein
MEIVSSIGTEGEELTFSASMSHCLLEIAVDSCATRICVIFSLSSMTDEIAEPKVAGFETDQGRKPSLDGNRLDNFLRRSIAITIWAYCSKEISENCQEITHCLDICRIQDPHDKVQSCIRKRFFQRQPSDLHRIYKSELLSGHSSKNVSLHGRESFVRSVRNKNTRPGRSAQ